MNAICCINELLTQFIDDLSNRNVFNQTDSITVNEKLLMKQMIITVMQ
jgi:hypothetical protein